MGSSKPPKLTINSESQKNFLDETTLATAVTTANNSQNRNSIRINNTYNPSQ